MKRFWLKWFTKKKLYFSGVPAVPFRGGGNLFEIKKKGKGIINSNDPILQGNSLVFRGGFPRWKGPNPWINPTWEGHQVFVCSPWLHLAKSGGFLWHVSITVLRLQRIRKRNMLRIAVSKLWLLIWFPNKGHSDCHCSKQAATELTLLVWRVTPLWLLFWMTIVACPHPKVWAHDYLSGGSHPVEKY